VDGLAACARLAPRVLWSNAASLYAWIVAEIAHDPSVPAAVVAGAEAVMLRHHWPDGRRNPLHAPPRTAGERRRRVCCLRYLLPQLA
ncbi:siderophore-iron reductase FhuF, partial [Methylobacterium nigriterrae]